MKIITKIVSETNEYSLTGYVVFGQKEEQQKLKEVINLKLNTIHY